MVRTFFSLLVCLLIFQAVNAQWNTDPFLNSAIADKTFDEIKPKIVTGSDGFSYLSYFSLESENFNLRMQKLDTLGNKLWDEAGLLISDFPSFEWIEYSDWDMKMNEEGSIILVFPDNRTGYTNIYAYKISPEGEFTWGENGIIISDNENEDANPKIAITNAGNIVFTWQRNPSSGMLYSKIICQKVSSSGELLWENELIVEDPIHDLIWPFIYPADNDEVILFWHWEDFLWWPDLKLYCQKIDGSGNTVWTQDLLIYSNQWQPISAPYLEICNDMNDRLFICWHEIIGGGPLSNTRIQQIDFDGNIFFEDGGINVSMNEDQNQMYPQLTILPQNQEVYIFWCESSFGQESQGLYGQKLSFSGTKLWGENGLEFIPLSSTFVEPIEILPSVDDILIFYKDNNFSDFAESKVKAMRINAQGEFVWYEESITLSEVQSDKSNFSAGEFYNNQWIIAWEDYRNDSADIYGQNIQLNGILGPISYEENIMIYPDSVYLPPSWNIESVHIINNGILPVEILNFPLFNYLQGWEWEITNITTDFPITIEPGSSLELLIHIITYTGSSEELGWSCDWVIVETATNTYEVELCVDEALLNIKQNIIRTKLMDYYPNPAKDKLTFTLEINQEINCEIYIFNSVGKKIKTFTTGNSKSIIWDLTDQSGQKVAPGTYYYKLNSTSFQESGKIILIE